MEPKSETVIDDIVVSGYFEPASVLRELKKKCVRPENNTLEDSKTPERNENEQGRSNCNILTYAVPVVVLYIRCLELKVAVIQTVIILIGDVSRTHFFLLARSRVICSERFMFGRGYYVHNLNI